MPKRVSLKGKGADIFFGDYSPAGLASPVAPEAPVPTTVLPIPLSAPEPRSESVLPAATEAPAHSRMRARTHACMPAVTHALVQDHPLERPGNEVAVRTAMRAQIYKKLQVKQRLSSYTFRFRPEELDQLGTILGELEKGTAFKPSKNDLIRLALLWMVADYDENGGESVAAQVLTRI